MGTKTEQPPPSPPPHCCHGKPKPRPRQPKLEETPERPLQPPVSVPFEWEEAPGKPKLCYSDSNSPPQLLEPPPRLWNGNRSTFSATPSPTTVLDGPYVGLGTRFGGSIKTFSFRKMIFGGGSFRSSNASTPEQQYRSREQDAAIGGSTRWGMLPERRDKEEEEEEELAACFRGDCERTRKRFLWDTLYESFKLVVPWRRNNGSTGKAQ